MKLLDIIKYEGDNSTFIWKHPCEDFSVNSQLIVHESQEAIFFMNGQALDLFGPGRHTLVTQNLPNISKLLKRTTDGETSRLGKPNAEACRDYPRRCSSPRYRRM